MALLIMESLHMCEKFLSGMMNSTQTKTNKLIMDILKVPVLVNLTSVPPINSETCDFFSA